MLQYRVVIVEQTQDHKVRLLEFLEDERWKAVIWQQSFEEDIRRRGNKVLYNTIISWDE